MDLIGIRNETQSNGSFNINSNNSNKDETKKDKEIEKFNKILQNINTKKKEFIQIMNKYIDENCEKFKKEEMKALFKDKFSDLAEKMTAKYEKEKKEKKEKVMEGKICSFSNNFSNSIKNPISNNFESQINSNKSNITNPSL